MSSSQSHLESTPHFPPFGLQQEESNWYAIHTRPRHEKWIAAQLEEKGVLIFLPVLQQIHQWSDRRSKVEVPLFSCYAFVRIVPNTRERLNVLRTPSVLGFVGNGKQGTPIPDYQIESLRTAIKGRIPLALHPFVSTGNRVRIRGGSLDGIEGVLVRQGTDQSLVLSVELLRRSISIRVEGYNIELA